jgi:hypothetical protein
MMNVCLFFAIESIQDGFHLLISFEVGNILPFLIIQCQVGQILHLIIGWKEIFFIASDQDIRMISDTVIAVKTFHFIEWLKGGHNNLDIFEFGEIGQDIPDLVFAVFTFGTEEHEQYSPVLFNIGFGHIMGAVHLEQADRREIRISDIRGLGWGGILCPQAGHQQQGSHHEKQSFHSGYFHKNKSKSAMRQYGITDRFAGKHKIH